MAESVPTETCSVSSCTQPGKLRCAGCSLPQSHYCSKECQKQDWGTHKLSCAGAQKYNCFLIRASASSTGVEEPTLAHHFEPFQLQAYGKERDEIAELKEKLGWEGAIEVGKFYDHRGSDTWYYYAYGPRSSTGSLPENKVASRCAGKRINGDVAVVRSGPVDSNDYPISFSKTELIRTAEFYKTTDPRKVFAKREESRTLRRFASATGRDPSEIPPPDISLVHTFAPSP